MALRPCKECGKEISSFAVVCPYCGEKPRTSAGFAILAVFGILILIGYIGDLRKKNSEGGGGNSPTSTNVTAKHAMGQEFSVGYWTYRCNGANWKSFIASEFGSVERPDAEFLIVDLWARNDDRTSSTLPPVKLTDPQGREFDESSKRIYLQDAFETLKQLNPGVSSRGLVLFDVPPGEYMLMVSGGYESGEHEFVDLSSVRKEERDQGPQRSSAPGEGVPNGGQNPPNDSAHVGIAPGQTTANEGHEPTPEQGINSLLDDWVQSFRQKDVTKQVECYAPQLDVYFRQHNLTRAFVETDKSWAFGRIAEIRKFEISNVQIYLDATNEATVTLNKTWDTTLTSGRPFAGSEVERLRLTLIDGRWKIKSEEEVAIYSVTR
jgi:hypothetical protein